MQSKLKEYMPKNVRDALGSRPTYHMYCMLVTGNKDGNGGIKRPGKTAKERAMKLARQ